MPTPSCCDRLTLRVVLLKVSPLVARLISVSDDLSLEELHDVLQLVLGWSGQAFYNFRIHGQEIGRQRLANPPPARVPASTPRKVPIHLRLPRSVGMGDCRSFQHLA